jgi:bacterial/archaeal transporter family-2 protein
MTNLYTLLMVLAGAGVAAQAVINAQLNAFAGSALWAMNISLAVSLALALAALASASVLTHVPPPAADLWRAPWWVWVGGAGGALYVLLAILLARRLGAALLLAAAVLGQVAASLLIDHYGWLGAPVHRLSAPRLVGAALLVVGVVLIRWR